MVATALALHTDDMTGDELGTTAVGPCDVILSIERRVTMNRIGSNSVVPVCALLVALPLAGMPLVAGPMNGTRHTVIAASGTAAPAGGNYTTFMHVTVNEWSQIAFDASLGGPSTSGVFVGDGTRTSMIALGGDPNPAAANFAFVGNSFFTADGGVVFDANFTDTFRYDGRVTIPLVQNGDPAPGGGTVTPLSRVTNGRGTIAYQASVIGGTATQGIFRTDGANTVVIASDAGAAPTGGTFTSLFTPAMNNRGQVAFETEMTGGPAEFAIVRGDGITLTPVFVADQIAPGGATFQDFGDPLINKQGQVVAVASLVNGASGAGLFIGDGANAVAIALDGQPAPKGGSYSASFDKPLTTNDRGEVAFSARLRGGTSPRGIFRWNAGETTTLALAGTIAPGTTGTFASFGDMKLGNDGRVAFIGTLVPGVGGVDFSNNMGIWVGTSDADLQLVVRTGEVIDGKVLMRLPSGLGQFDMNDDAIVWIGTFPSRSTAVVFSRTRSESEDTQDRDSHHQR